MKAGSAASREQKQCDRTFLFPVKSPDCCFSSNRTQSCITFTTNADDPRNGLLHNEFRRVNSSGGYPEFLFLVFKMGAELGKISERSAPSTQKSSGGKRTGCHVLLNQNMRSLAVIAFFSCVAMALACEYTIREAVLPRAGVVETLSSGLTSRSPFSRLS